ncbi:MAG: Ig-like domain-containing protein [Muribaculaceae bacterium]|nr:Ig-like domain-containing protein [Muribaculaceae bacterium]
MKLEKTSYIVLTILIAALLYSCASIGRPTGGNKDIDPPVFTGSNPAPNSTNVKNQSIVLHFNEYIVLKDQSTKVVVSPAQKENPSIRANGKRINIELRDTLIPNTTYSIDFSDAIQDNNENNPLQGFSFAFATGDTIDTLQISGIVLNARDLEPQKEFFVGVHSCLDDSAFSKLPLERIARTNELGQFTIRNIKPGRYHIFALNDADRNYKFARSEDLAFLEEIIVPSVTEIETMDTVFTSQMVTDTIYKATHSLFLPNDILLSSFNEDYKSLYLVNNERTSDRRFNVLFSAPSDSLPTLEVLKPEGFDNSKKWYILDNSQHNDTLNYWITDTMLIKSDSIRVNMRYLHTDTNDMRTFTNDTIYFNLKKMKKKGNKKVEKKKEEEGKDSLDSIPQIQLLKFAAASSGTIDVYAPFRFKSEEPIDSINPAMIHLKQKIDTIWEDRGIVELKRDSASSILNYKVEYDWEPGGTYGITIDSLAITGIYGLYNGTISQEFKVKELEEYSNLFFKVNVTDSAFVELLDKSDKVVRTAPVENGMADLFNINPGEYYARIVLDANGNGKWDTGNYSQHLQPEEVYYFSKKLNLKQNWDIEETWDIYELPIDVQKPMAIKKNKPKNYREQTKPEDEEEEEEEFGTNFNNMNSYTGNKYNDTRNRTNGFNRR